MVLVSQTIREPGLFGNLCRWLMPTQSVCNAVDVNVHAYAKIPEIKLVSQSTKAITRRSANKFHTICKLL
jgi:hypothetical protein